MSREGAMLIYHSLPSLPLSAPSSHSFPTSPSPSQSSHLSLHCHFHFSSLLFSPFIPYPLFLPFSILPFPPFSPFFPPTVFLPPFPLQLVISHTTGIFIFPPSFSLLSFPTLYSSILHPTFPSVSSHSFPASPSQSSHLSNHCPFRLSFFPPFIPYLLFLHSSP